MDKLMGTYVEAHLKSKCVVRGTVFDLDEICVYIQQDADNFVAIPRDNVDYFSAAVMHSESILINTAPDDTPEIISPLHAPQTQPTEIRVIIDNYQVTAIPVAPAADLSVFTDDIMQFVLNDPDVAHALTGRVQKSVEYDVGIIKFITDASDETPPKTTTPNVFSVDGDRPASDNFLSPSQMASRLNGVVCRGKK